MLFQDTHILEDQKYKSEVTVSVTCSTHWLESLSTDSVIWMTPVKLNLLKRCQVIDLRVAGK